MIRNVNIKLNLGVSVVSKGQLKNAWQKPFFENHHPFDLNSSSKLRNRIWAHNDHVKYSFVKKKEIFFIRVNDSFEEFSGVHVSGNLVAGTPDTISESGSMKSRSRRTLPYLPPEEPAPLPTQAKKAQERMRYTPTALLTRYISQSS